MSSLGVDEVALEDSRHPHGRSGARRCRCAGSERLVTTHLGVAGGRTLSGRRTARRLLENVDDERCEIAAGQLLQLQRY